MAQVASDEKKDENECEAGGLVDIHIKARTSPYPCNIDKAIERLVVADEKVAWDTAFADYKPPFFTHPAVVANNIPDDSLAKMQKVDPKYAWNALDGKRKDNGIVDRRSHHGQYELDDADAVPLNPMGRTGLRGRGLLWRWGPNHAADPIVTRWKRVDNEPTGKVIKHGESEQPILEFIAIKRRDGGGWAIPGGMVDSNELSEHRVGGKVSMTLAREFGEEAMDSLGLKGAEKQKVMSEVSAFFAAAPVTVYKGYCDDPRNTDNSWMETTACNFHDADGSTVGALKLKAGDDAGAVKWMAIGHELKLYASHQGMLERVAKLHKAHW